MPPFPTCFTQKHRGLPAEGLHPARPSALLRGTAPLAWGGVLWVWSPRRAPCVPWRAGLGAPLPRPPHLPSRTPTLPSPKSRGLPGTSAHLLHAFGWGVGVLIATLQKVPTQPLTTRPRARLGSRQGWGQAAAQTAPPHLS